MGKRGVSLLLALGTRPPDRPSRSRREQSIPHGLRSFVCGRKYVSVVAWKSVSVCARVFVVYTVKKEQRSVARVLARGREIVQAVSSAETDPGAVRSIL